MLALVAKSTAMHSNKIGRIMAESDRKCDNKKIKEDKRFTMLLMIKVTIPKAARG